jgi:hypothetical protein
LGAIRRFIKLASAPGDPLAKQGKLRPYPKASPPCIESGIRRIPAPSPRSAGEMNADGLFAPMIWPPQMPRLRRTPPARRVPPLCASARLYRRVSHGAAFQPGARTGTLGEHQRFIRCVRDRPSHENSRASRSYLVKLDDGSTWQIFPGDIDHTLAWLPTTELRLFEINDDVASHALINSDDGTRVRVLPQGEEWPRGKLTDVLKQG